jgi:hypothetical protein
MPLTDPLRHLLTLLAETPEHPPTASTGTASNRLAVSAGSSNSMVGWR